MPFSDKAIAARLYAGFGLILALLAVVLVAMAKVERINGALQASSEEHVQVQRYAINFRGSAHDRSIAVRDVVLGNTPAERQKGDRHHRRPGRLLRGIRRTAGKLIARPGAAPNWRGCTPTSAPSKPKAVATTQAIIAQAEAGDAAARETLWQQAKPQYVQWLAAINSSSTSRKPASRPTAPRWSRRAASWP